MVMAPMCTVCTRYNTNDKNKNSCEAFQDEIPSEIQESKFDHRQPYQGDGGKQFDGVDDDALYYVEELFGD